MVYPVKVLSIEDEDESTLIQAALPPFQSPRKGIVTSIKN